MKYFTLYRENNNFTDILSDAVLKKTIDEKIMWYRHLLVGISEHRNQDSISYMTLKYGDDMVSNLTPDYSPIAGVDYIPRKRT